MNETRFDAFAKSTLVGGTRRAFLARIAGMSMAVALGMVRHSMGSAVQRVESFGENVATDHKGTAVITVYGQTVQEKELVYSVFDGKAFFEGDIILGSAEEMEDDATLTTINAVVCDRNCSRWPNGIIPYDDESAVRDRARTAIEHWETAMTPIRFIERTDANASQYPDYVSFREPRQADYCASSLGMKGGQQFIWLGPSCSSGTAIHEIGHAIGLWHEQSRDDRDRWVNIIWGNIVEGAEDQFERHVSDGEDVGSYDCSSIMHYRADAFGREDPNNPGTRLTTIESSACGGSIGQRSGLSDGDINAAKFMYSLGAPWSWSENVRLEGKTSQTAPALAAFNGELYLVHLGESSRQLWYDWSEDGQRWRTDSKLEGKTSKATPALAASDRALHLVHLGESSSQLWYSRSDDGGSTWTENVRLEGKTSKAAPALADLNGALHLVHLGEASSQLWYSTLTS